MIIKQKHKTVFQLLVDGIPFKIIEKKKWSSVVKPSLLPTAMHCQGSMLLNRKYGVLDKTWAEKGRKLHAIAAQHIKRIYKEQYTSYSSILKEEENEFIKDYVVFCISNGKTASIMGVETGVQDIYNNIFVSGYIDYWDYDQKSQTLRVVDLKTGFANINDNAKYQLYFYALALIQALKAPVKYIELYIYTRFRVASFYPSKKELVNFKSELAQKLTDYNFTYGKHCSTCFSFNQCSFAKEHVASFISKTLKHDTPDLKNILAHKSIMTKFYKQIEEEIKAKCLQNDSHSYGPYYLTSRKRIIWDPAKKKEIEKKLHGLPLTPTQAKKMKIDITDLVTDSFTYTVNIKE